MGEGVGEGPFGKAQKRDRAAVWPFWPISPNSGSIVSCRALRWAIPSNFSQDFILPFKQMCTEMSYGLFPLLFARVSIKQARGLSSPPV